MTKKRRGSTGTELFEQLERKFEKKCDSLNARLDVLISKDSESEKR